MSRRNKVLFIMAIFFTAIQFIPAARNESGQLLPADFTRSLQVPGNIQAVLKRSCYDCHSDHTRYPWYSTIQPVRWMLDKHIREGKEELNFSEFGNYSKRKQRNKLQAVINSIKDESMPLFSYTLMHPDSKITEENKILLINWFQATKEGLQ